MTLRRPDPEFIGAEFIGAEFMGAEFMDTRL